MFDSSQLALLPVETRFVASRLYFTLHSDTLLRALSRDYILKNSKKRTLRKQTVKHLTFITVV